MGLTFGPNIQWESCQKMNEGLQPKRPWHDISCNGWLTSLCTTPKLMEGKYPMSKNKNWHSPILWGNSHMGVSKNRETPQNGWFIVGKPYSNGWFGGTPIFGNPYMKSQLLKSPACVQEQEANDESPKLAKHIAFLRLPRRFGSHGFPPAAEDFCGLIVINILIFTFTRFVSN